MLTKDQILAADDVRFEDVKVPEWGGVVRIQTMTGMARDRYEQTLFDKKSKGITLQNIRAKLVASCAVDEEGALIFDETDTDALGKKSGKALDRLYEAAQRVNGITDVDVEELEKNLEAVPSGDSISG